MSHADEVIARVAREKRENDLQLLLAVVILLVVLLLGCARATSREVCIPVPVCSQNRGILCYAPSPERDRKWEHANVCPARTDLTLRGCYRFAGVVKGRQLYVYQSPDGDDNP